MTDITDLPEFSNIEQIAEALWGADKKRGAAVMIGAGFSRLAIRLSTDTPAPPLWNDFEKAMQEVLYPNGGGPRDPSFDARR